MSEPRMIALAGNPNVGKSTVFNALTGLHQHTGNWPGKTVASARGVCRLDREEFLLIDVPGAYSLWAQSAEEEVALEAVCFSGAQAVIVVCDATCLERNLNLVYQILEITPRVVVCVNLLDEARKKGILLNLPALEEALGVPVVGACARAGKGVKQLLAAARGVMERAPAPRRAIYPEKVELAVERVARALEPDLCRLVNARFAALRLLEGDPCFRRELCRRRELSAREEEAVRAARESLGDTDLAACQVEAIFQAAENASRAAIVRAAPYSARQLRADRLLTGRITGLPVMLLLLLLVFFLTLRGANVPSGWLSEGFARLGALINQGLVALGAPPFLQSLLVDGIYRTLTQVIAVMLPPMAIFFPLFTLLEDLGYLPRMAFTLDRFFERCHACGKQALTMWMVDSRTRKKRNAGFQKRAGGSVFLGIVWAC